MNRMSILGYLSLFCFCLSLGCVDVKTNHQLSLTNRSGKKIAILYSNLNNSTLTENNIAFYLSERNIIYPDSSYDIIKVGNENAWCDYINQSRAKKLFVYVFAVDTLAKYNGVYSMDEIVKQNKFLKSFEYSIKELDEQHWNITYR